MEQTAYKVFHTRAGFLIIYELKKDNHMRSVHDEHQHSETL